MQANRFLREEYIGEFNRRFAVEPHEPGESAFVACICEDLDRVFSIQTERTVNRDNTVKYRNLTLQIDKQSWWRSMGGCRVTVYQHLDASVTIGYGPQQLGKYTADGVPLAAKAHGNAPAEENDKTRRFPHQLGKATPKNGEPFPHSHNCCCG